MKKSLFLVGGTVAFCAGAIMLNNANSITGFSVLENILPVSSILGITFIAGGLISLIAGTRFGGVETKVMEGLMPLNNFANTLIKKAHDGAYMIADTSAILAYKEENVGAALKDAKIHVPESVMKELHKGKLRDGVEKNLEIILDSPEYYYEKAKEILEKTGKPNMRRILRPYLTGEKKDPGHKEMAEMLYAIKAIECFTKAANININYAETHNKETREKIINYLDTHCTVSDTDASVLGNAMMYSAKNKKKVYIVQKDVDLREGIENLKREMPEIGQYIFSVDPYEKN